MELELVTKKMDAIDGFPNELKTLVKHMLISHHGKYEFGSPKLPMFPEALVLHFLDDMDSKVAAARAVLESNAGEGQFSAYSGALERRMLRVKEYCHDDEPAARVAESQSSNGERETVDVRDRKA
jgi:3'-5' exoribonuclease